LSAPANGSPVADEVVLLRLPRPPADYIQDKFRPSERDFLASSADKEQAASQGTPVRVSVWDSTRTTAKQGANFRGGSVVVIRVRARAVRDAGQSQQLPVRVVYDTLPEPESLMPGADGHAGIEGLSAAPGCSKETKESLRKLRHAIAMACDPHVERLEPG
jgi:hypothetical protein